MFEFRGDVLDVELTPQQVKWLRFACEHARDAAADSGDEQLHAGIITLATLFGMAQVAAEHAARLPAYERPERPGRSLRAGDEFDLRVA